MKLSLAIQLTALLVTLVAVTSAQDERAKVLHELDGLLTLAERESDQLTDQEKVEVDVVRSLKDAIEGAGVGKRSVDESGTKELVRRKRFPWLIAGASALAGYIVG